MIDMAKYSLEIVRRNGNTFRDVDCTLIEARKTAIRLIHTHGGKFATYVNIIKVTKGWKRSIIERIDFDVYINDWTCVQFGKEDKSPLSRSRHYRLSAKTGKLLNWDKNMRYL